MNITKDYILSDAVLIQPEPRIDERGYFMRVYDENIFIENNLKFNWVQENQSYSKHKGTIRGLHFQFPPYTETKLVRCLAGAIIDVIVDLRANSNSFGKWISVELSEENKKMLIVPRGFAHGFCTLTDNCLVYYKVDNYYNSSSEGGIKYNDRDLNIDWPVDIPIISGKDLNLVSFAEFKSTYNSILV